MRSFVFSLLALLFVPVPPANAGPSWSHCGDAVVALTDLLFLVTTPAGWRLYQESNAIPNLQRSIDQAFFGGARDTCDECAPYQAWGCVPDTLLW